MSSEPGSEDDTAPEAAPRRSGKLPTFLVQASAPARPEVLGGYAIVGELGRGGTSVVYEGRDPRTGARVAIKLLDARGQRRGGVERFEIEAWAVARIRHPGVVPIFDAVIDDERAYIIMDLMPGGSLADRLAREGPLPPRQAAAWMAQVAEAIAAAHARGIIHRDLKPANILIAEDGRAAVTDFGMAKARGLSSFLEPSFDGGIIGTPGFMAPEQIRGDAVDPRTDVYGLGATLYALVTGAPPFRSGTVPGLLEKVLDQPPEPPSAKVRGLPRILEDLALCCLEKDPDRRPASAENFARACRAIARGKSRSGLILALALALAVALVAFFLGRWSAGL